MTVARALRANAKPGTSSPGTPTTRGEVLMAVHEEVFRAWPALAAAIADRRADLQVRTWLRRDADRWLQSGRGQASLTGGRLDIALDWSRRNPAEVTEPVRAFIAQGRRQWFRRRLLAVAAPILALVAIVVGVFAVQANDARGEAEALRLVADARAAFDSRLDLGLLLALQARTRSADMVAQSATLVGLTQGAGPRRYQDSGGPIVTAALDSTGSHAVLARSDQTILWDVDLGRMVASIPGPASAVSISADGAEIALARSATIELRRWADPSSVRSCPLADAEIEQVRVSGDGTLAIAVTVDRAATSPRSHIELVATDTCEVRVDDWLDGQIVSIDIDPTSERIAFGTEGHGVTVWEASTGASFTPFDSPDMTARAVALGPADDLAVLTDEGDLLWWDSDRKGGAPTKHVRVFDTPGTILRFVADGPTLLAGGHDGELAIVDPTSDVPVGPLLSTLPSLGYAGYVDIVEGTPTSTGAVTIDRSGRLVTWDLTGRPPLGPQLLSDVRVDEILGLDDGSALAAGGSTVWLLDGESGAIRSQNDALEATALAARGSTVAIGTQSGDVLVGMTDLGRLHAVGPRANEPIAGVAVLASGAVASVDTRGHVVVVSPSGEVRTVDIGAGARSMTADDTRLFIGSANGSVGVMDPSDGSGVPAWTPAHASEVTAIALRPDGAFLASGSDDRNIIVWTVGADGRLTMVDRLIGQGEKVTSLTWSGDGRWLASAGEDGRVILWDVPSALEIGDPIPVSGVPAVAFARTGDRQLFVAGDGLARWDMRPDAWARIACTIAGGRSFSAIEQDRYGVTTSDAGCPR